MTVVTSIPNPRFRDVKRTPLKFSNCTTDFNCKGARVDGHPQQYAHERCAKVMPFIQLMQAQEKDLLGSLRTHLVNDLYAAIPELSLNYKHSRPLRSAKKSHRPKRKKPNKMVDKVKRGFGAVIMSAIPGLITLAVESLSSWIKGKQNHQIDGAVAVMRRSNFEIQNELKQYKDDSLMYGKYSAESLTDVIKSVNALHLKNTRLERLVVDHKFGKISDVMATVNYNFELQLFMEQAKEEHVAQLRQMKQAGKDLLDSIAILNQRRLPRDLFSDDQLRQILSVVEIMVKKKYPDYTLAVTNISHYHDMKMVTFAVDQQTHSLIVIFPAFIKDYKQPPLALFEIESVPVPIKDSNK